MLAQSDGSSDKRKGNEWEKLMDSTGLSLMGCTLTWLMASVCTEIQIRLGKKPCMLKAHIGRVQHWLLQFAVVLVRGFLLYPPKSPLCSHVSKKDITFLPHSSETTRTNRTTGNSFKPVIVQEPCKPASMAN